MTHQSRPTPRPIALAQFARSVWAIPEVGVLIPLVAFTAIFAILSPALLSRLSIIAMLRGRAFIGLVAVGEAILMIAGELDLSVGSVAGMSAIVSAVLMQHGWPVALGLLAGVACGALAGLVNGIIAVGIGVPAFIVTLGMLYIARGIDYLICKGIQLPVPTSVVSFGEAEPMGLSWAFWIFVIAVVIADLVLRFTTVGRKIFATGGNVEVARVAGINTSAVKIACYVLTGALSGIAGMLVMAQYSVAQAETGTGWELTVIASVVIGGVSLFGGSGSVIAACMGVMILQIVESGLTMLSDRGVDSHWQTVAIGAIMIGSVAFDVFRRRAKAS